MLKQESAQAVSLMGARGVFFSFIIFFIDCKMYTSYITLELTLRWIIPVFRFLTVRTLEENGQK